MLSNVRMSRTGLILIICAVLFFLLFLINNYLIDDVLPEVVAKLAVRQFDPDGKSTAVRISEHLKNVLLGVEGGMLIVIGLLLFVPLAWKRLLRFFSFSKQEKPVPAPKPAESEARKPNRRKKKTMIRF